MRQASTATARHGDDDLAPRRLTQQLDLIE
jgi:hypothetical protein